MPKEIIAKKKPVTAVYRFYGRDIYLKSSNVRYGDQLIAQIIAKGGTIVKSGGWIKADLITDKEVIRIAGKEFFMDSTPDSEIEMTFYDLFYNTLLSQGFTVDGRDI